MSYTLKIKRIHEGAKIPSYAHSGDAGLDLFACEDVTIKPNTRALIRTGIAMEIPKTCVGLIWDKSGISVNHGLKVLAGVIDAGYRGEVLVCLMNLSKETHSFKKDEKIAQMIIQKKEKISIKEVKELSNTSRGKGGFGSTGKK
jgi:dUTP pyrophosphatase